MATVTSAKSKRKESDARWRARITRCYEILRNIIPNEKIQRKRKVPKALILKETSNHITFLEEVLGMLLIEIASTNDPSCANLKELSLAKIREEFFEKQILGEVGNLDQNLKIDEPATGKFLKMGLNAKSAGEQKPQNPCFSQLEADLAHAVHVRETDLQYSVNRPRCGAGLPSISRKPPEYVAGQLTENIWSLSHLLDKENVNKRDSNLAGFEEATVQRNVVPHLSLSGVPTQRHATSTPGRTHGTPNKHDVVSYRISGSTPQKLVTRLRSSEAPSLSDVNNQTVPESTLADEYDVINLGCFGSTPSKLDETSFNLHGILPYTLSPVVDDGDDYGLPPPTPSTPMEGEVFSFNFGEFISPSGLTPIKLLHPTTGPGITSGSETESVADTPRFKYADTSRVEDNVDEAEKNLLCEEKFENIDFEDEMDYNVGPLRRVRRKCRASAVPAERPHTPPNATPPQRRSLEMMQGRTPAPRCRRKLEESFPEPTEKDNQHKLTDGNDFDGFLVFYKELIGQLEKYLTPAEIKSKATFSVISKIWDSLAADQKNSVIAMAMIEEFVSTNQNLDDDLKDLAVVPIDHNPHKVDVVSLDLEDFYAKAVQEILSTDERVVPQSHVPITESSSDDGSNDVEMFEVPIVYVQEDCKISPTVALATACCFEGSNESQASNNSDGFVPTFSLQVEPTLHDFMVN